MKKLIITGALIAALTVPTIAGAATDNQANEKRNFKGDFKGKIERVAKGNMKEMRELSQKYFKGEITFDDFKEEAAKLLPEDKKIDFDKMKERLDKTKEKMKDFEVRKEINDEYLNGDITIDECIDKLKAAGCEIKDEAKLTEILKVKKQLKDGEITKEEAKELLPNEFKGRLNGKLGTRTKKIKNIMKGENSKQMFDACKKYLNDEISKDELQQELSEIYSDNIDKKIQILDLQKQLKKGEITKEEFIEQAKEIKNK
ncbi:hypothetical protein [Abyssisolibacter fermentans]|uniref:hypothetical protein n=1 Tax=Abyssisolibacter fermentans TaxID=1766203 RepID=UPI000830553A|nr:hypothetical protein [Abyssisolibacter fermentans]